MTRMTIQCQIIRGDWIESVHLAYAVGVNASHQIIFQSGDPEYQTCVRSALKPFQAAASVQSGAVDEAGFTPKELALMCGSHNGEPIHVETAQSMLKKLGFGMEQYECGVHFPFDREARKALIQQQEEPSPFHNNCSGKHAGMLCLAKQLRVDPKGYVDQDHPVQQKIMQTVKHYAGVEKLDLAIDGCSAPTPFLPLVSIARMFRQLAAGDDPVLDRIYTAMTTNPYLVAGKKRFDTDFMTVLKGRAVTKVGGEGVRGIGIRTKEGEVLGFAVKILDGNQRVSAPATMAILNQLDLLTPAERDELKGYEHPLLKNHRGIQVGKIKIQLTSSMGLEP
jgi:L-asparaginase II